MLEDRVDRQQSSIDLNSDLGEGFGPWSLGDDSAMLRIVTSANIACGFHAGDAAGLLDTARSAVQSGVAIGAQVSYRDLAGFGRRFIDVSRRDLVADVLYQIGALDGLARAAGSAVRYVKPHGALYNAIVFHRQQAEAVVEAVGLYSRELPIVGLPGSLVIELSEQAGLRTIREGFVDRGYTPEGTLVDRALPGAVIHDVEQAADRALRMVVAGEVVAVDGTVVPLRVDSLCIHGDTPGAVELAVAVRERLTEHGMTIESFVDA